MNVTVDVKPARLSKINWTQIVALVVMVLSLFGIEMDDKTRADLLAGLIGVQSVVTFVLRTWFTKEVTPQSVATTTVMK